MNPIMDTRSPYLRLKSSLSNQAHSAENPNTKEIRATKEDTSSDLITVEEGPVDEEDTDHTEAIVEVDRAENTASTIREASTVDMEEENAEEDTAGIEAKKENTGARTITTDMSKEVTTKVRTSTRQIKRNIMEAMMITATSAHLVVSPEDTTVETEDMKEKVSDAEEEPLHTSEAERMHMLSNESEAEFRSEDKSDRNNKTLSLFFTSNLYCNNNSEMINFNLGQDQESSQEIDKKTDQSALFETGDDD